MSVWKISKSCKLLLINTSDQMRVHLIKFRRGTAQFQEWDVCDVLSILKKEHFSILGWFGGVMMRGGCNDCAGSRPFLHINYRLVAANATHSVRHIHQTRLFEFDRRNLITKPKSMVKGRLQKIFTGLFGNFSLSILNTHPPGTRWQGKNRKVVKRMVRVVAGTSLCC